MSSSSDFEDAPPISKSPNTALPKKEASSSYLTMLNANNKFSEMLKNKIKQTGVSPILNKHNFNPVASSTQIGTPEELKRKSTKKQSDVDTSPKKKGSNSKDSVIVKKEPVSFESSDENITEQPKLKKKKADSQMESKRRKEEAQTATSAATNESGSSVDSESDSESSAPSSPRTKRNKESSSHGASVRKRSSSDESSQDEGRPTIISKEPTYGQSNSKINFSKFNSKTKNKKSNSDSETDNLPPPLQIKREMPSDVEHASKKKKHKDKHKMAPKPSSSSSSEHQDHVSASPSLQEESLQHVSKKEKYKKKVPPKANSSSSSEGDDDVAVKASSSYTGKQSMTHTSSDSPSEKNVSKASDKGKTKHKKHAVVVENGDNTSSSSSESEAATRIEKAGKIRKRQAERLSEDDDESMHQTKKSAASRLRKLEKEDSLETVGTSFDVLNNITSKEDVYIIQIPVKLDPRRLIGSSISLNGSVRFNKKYDSIVSLESQDPIVVCTNNQSKSLKVIRPAGTIKLQRRLRYEKVSEVPELIDKTVAFPSNLKSRHPLFGSNFDNKIDLDEHVKMKLNSLCESNVKKKKKKKKAVKLENAQEEEIFKILTVGNEESAPVEKKKKKKKKKSEDHELEDESMSKKRKHSESEDLPKKKKKKKHKEDSSDTLIQAMLSSKMATLDMTKKKKKKKEEC